MYYRVLHEKYLLIDSVTKLIMVSLVHILCMWMVFHCRQYCISKTTHTDSKHTKLSGPDFTKSVKKGKASKPTLRDQIFLNFFLSQEGFSELLILSLLSICTTCHFYQIVHMPGGIIQLFLSLVFDSIICVSPCFELVSSSLS